MILKMRLKKVLIGILMSAIVLIGPAGSFAAAGTDADTVSSATQKASTMSAQSTGTPPTGAPSSGTPPTGTPPSGTPPTGAPGMTGKTTKSTGTASYTLSGKTAVLSGKKITAQKVDQSGIKVSKKGSLTLSGITVTKTGATSSDENSNFYGLNAGILAESGSKITLKNSTITTHANGSNGVFASGADSKIYVSNVTIKTTKDSSRGLDATLKGTIVANNVNIDTKGAHCAGLATDRGNGTVSLTGGTLTTAGEGSPGIYSTGDISATNATITASGSEAAVIEGKNTITLLNTDITGMKKQGVMLYQSFSGDAEVGTSKFNMTGGSLTAAEGPLFYATNTDAVVELNKVKLANKSGILISASAGKWGTTGSNGATLKFTAKNQTLAGQITCDKISEIKMVLSDNTTFTGQIDQANTAGMIAINLDQTSVWNVTGTSYVTTIADEDNTLANIIDNGNTIYYDASNEANSWLEGKSITLSGGGQLVPVS